MDSEAKKACSTQAETNQRHLYAHCTATHTCTLHHVHITSTSSSSSYDFQHLLKAAKKGEETSKFKKIEISKGI